MNLEQIKNHPITQKIIVFFKELWKFLKTKLFIKNFLIALGIAIAFFSCIFLFLNIFTHHGESMFVPDFRKLSLKEVEKIAKSKKLRFEVIDSVYNAADFKPGTVVGQTPPPNFKVKEGRTIFLTIKTFNDEKIPMPDFRSVSLIQAKADMETYGFKLGNIREIPAEHTDVIEQNYKGKPILPGTLIIKGETIDLVIGKGDKKDDDQSSKKDSI